jgi:autotransporter-associated beta strand protein
LNGFTDDVDSLDLTGGTVLTGLGTLQLRGNVTAIGDSAGLTFFNAQISGHLDLGSSTRTFTVNDSSFLLGLPVDLVVDAVITGSGGFIKTGAGEMELDGANTYTGSTTVNNGNLIIGNDGALGSTSPGTVVNDPGRITLTGGITVLSEPLTLNTTASTPGALFGSGPTNFWGGNIFLNRTTSIEVATNSFLNLGGTVLGPGGLTKDGPGELIFTGSTSNSYAGLTIVNAGTIFCNKLGTDFAVPGDLVVGDGAGGTDTDVVFYSFTQIGDQANVTVNSSGLLVVGADTIGSVGGSGDVEILDTGSLQTGGNNASTVLDGILSGGGDLIKQGTGTFTLNGNNTYAGATAVQTGTLAVNGVQTASPVTVFATPPSPARAASARSMSLPAATSPPAIAPDNSPPVPSCSAIMPPSTSK